MDGRGGLRRRLALALDPELRRKPGLSRLNRAILVLILVSVTVGILDTEASLHDAWRGPFLALELFCLGAFTMEYAGRLWVAPENPRYPNRLSWALSPAALIDPAVIATLLVPMLGLETTVLRLFRVLRLLRLARLGRFSVAMQLLIGAVASRSHESAVGSLMGGVVLLFAASGLYLAEGHIQPEAFGSIPRAMWWAVATLTTMGYGDAVPVTPVGRFLAALTALGGVAIIAIPAGLLAGAFSEALAEAKKHRQHDGDDPPA
ncbi:MAG: potassium channel family protein [Gemmobacter sp.]